MAIAYRLNLLTVGQSVRVTHGKYATRTGRILRICFYADARRAHTQYRVRLSGALKGTYGANYLEVATQ